MVVEGYTLTLREQVPWRIVIPAWPSDILHRISKTVIPCYPSISFYCPSNLNSVPEFNSKDKLLVIYNGCPKIRIDALKSILTIMFGPTVRPATYARGLLAFFPTTLKPILTNHFTGILFDNKVTFNFNGVNESVYFLKEPTAIGIARLMDSISNVLQHGAASYNYAMEMWGRLIPPDAINELLPLINGESYPARPALGGPRTEEDTTERHALNEPSRAEETAQNAQEEKRSYTEPNNATAKSTSPCNSNLVGAEQSSASESNSNRSAESRRVPGVQQPAVPSVKQDIVISAPMAKKSGPPKKVSSMRVAHPYMNINVKKSTPTTKPVTPSYSKIAESPSTQSAPGALFEMGVRSVGLNTMTKNEVCNIHVAIPWPRSSSGSSNISNVADKLSASVELDSIEAYYRESGFIIYNLHGTAMNIAFATLLLQTSLSYASLASSLT